jgi:hypothetical protein
MFELLSNVRTVPVDKSALVMVQRGMNKVRVSVGAHNSEPSEVYIVTGQAGGKLETYIIFYILAPGVHVVYGFDQNPYAPDLQEKVVEEATVFVEEMGAILEVVPLETMTPDQRSAWIDREVLYSEPVMVDLEEVQEIDDLEVVQIEETGTEETRIISHIDTDHLEGFVEVSDEDVSQAMSEESMGEEFPETVPMDGDMDLGIEPPDQVVAEGVEAAGEDSVVVADGDFDELLKQAFLKPDIVEKTRMKSALQEEKSRVEELLPEVQDDADEGGISAETGPPVEGAGTDEVEAVYEESHLSAEPDAGADPVIQLPDEESASYETRGPAGFEDKDSPGSDAPVKVIRFLSKY